MVCFAFERSEGISNTGSTRFGLTQQSRIAKNDGATTEGKIAREGEKVSGRKVELIERLLQQMQVETGGARGEKRNIPEAGDTAINATDVFIPLDKTIQKLEDLLQSRRVVFIRAGVATGKSTLAEHLARTQSSKYLQVHPLQPTRRCLKRAGRMNCVKH